MVFPEMLPNVAVMVVGPAATDVARPALLIVATLLFVEAHVTEAVRDWVVLS